MHGACVVHPVGVLHTLAGHAGVVEQAPAAQPTSQAHEAVQSIESHDLGPMHVAVSAPIPETMRSHEVGPVHVMSHWPAFMHQFVHEHEVSPEHSNRHSATSSQ